MKVREHLNLNSSEASNINDYIQLAIIDGIGENEGWYDNDEVQEDNIVSETEAIDFLNKKLSYRSNLILVGQYDGGWVELISQTDED